MNEHISDERIADILDKVCKDWLNLRKFYLVADLLVQEDRRQIPQEDRQKLVEAYNLYRAAPYMWYEKEDK